MPARGVGPFEGEDGNRVEYNESEMRSLGALSADSSSQTTLDQSLLRHEIPVPFRGKYKTERLLSVTMSRTGNFPMFQAASAPGAFQLWPWSLCAAPPPHRTDCCRPIRRRGGVKGRFACTFTSHFDLCLLSCGQIGP